MDKSSNLANGASANQTHCLNPTSARESLAAADRSADRSSSTKPLPQVSQAPSTTSNSSLESREPSPTRPSARSTKSAKTATSAAPSSVLSAAAASVQATLPFSSPTTPSTSPSSRPLRRKSTTQQDPSPSRSIRSGVAANANANTNTNSNSNTNSTTTAISSPSQTASLSNTIIPTLTPAPSDASAVQTPGPQKSELPSLPSPRWPVSGRLRSPPPSLQRPEHSHSGTAAALPVEPVPTPSDSEAEDAHMLSGMRTPSRAAAIGSGPMLETVQEASPLASPRILDAALEKLETASVTSNASIATSMSEIAEVSPSRTIRARYLTIQNPFESGSESGGGAGNTRAGRRGAGPTSNPPLLTPRHSSSTIRGSISKGKTGEGAQPTMTVETETVTSIPNVAVGPATAQGANGSLRTRPSNETIRPKKEKRRASRKQAVTQGTGTSKADIFEAKVASAVDEANTSDSEETFVYDSNPADGRDRPHRFHHSRTPSATSLANTDRNGMRSIHSVLEGSAAQSATVKKMKFVNTFGNTSGNDSALGDDEGKGSASRGPGNGSGRGTGRLHHHVGGGSHIGRWGLSGPRNGGHQSLFDNESPFASNGTMRLKMNSGSGSNGSSSAQPRPGIRPLGGSGSGSINGMRGSGVYSKRGGLGYDMEEASSGMGSRDGNSERTPLLEGSMRSGRNGRSSRRPPHMSLRALEHQPHQGSYAPPPSFLNRFASCLVLTVMLMLVITGAIGFMFATSQPLEDIELVKISSVLASEQELMFDLMVRAHNPNVVVVSVDAADMEVFAKSPHAGTDSEWWRRPHGGKEEEHHHREHDKKKGEVSIDGNEPRDQPDSSPNFLLGKFTTFDNPLSFEGSFFHHGFSTSRSGVRIRRPGNGTAGGSERWERILDDEFDLIVKGVLRYSLPLSQRVRSALIEGRTTVKPNAAEDPVVHPNGTATIS